MSPKTVELVLSLLEAAGTMAAMLPVLGAKWRARRDEVQLMIDEDRDPTDEEHAFLAADLAELEDELDAALKAAQAGQTEPETKPGPDEWETIEPSGPVEE